MRWAIAALLVGWALVTAGIAALTTPWVWALSLGLVLVVCGGVPVVAVVRERQETMARPVEPAGR